MQLFFISRRLPGRLWGAGLAGLLCAALGVHAAQNIAWEVDSRADFEAGQPQGVRIADPGLVSLAPSTQSPKDAKAMSDPLVWSLARDAQGNLFLGTGNEGRVYRWGTDGKIELWATLSAAEVYALAVDADGQIFAGASPSGIVYKIDAKGRTSIYHRTGATYIWSMAFDAEGRLVLSTGKPAQILRITGPEQAEVLLTSNEAHLISLLVARDGTLYAGSVGEGLLYEVPVKGKPTIRWDSPAHEVRALAEGPDGALFIVGAPEVKVAPRAPGQAPATQAETRVNKTSHVYRLARDGDLAVWWQSPNALILCMIADGEGGVLVGTDKEGTLYHLPAAGQSVALLRAPGEMLLSLLSEPDGGMALGSGNPGRALRVSRELAQKGELLSDVKDFGIASRFGQLDWTSSGRGNLSFYTRSGNSAKPDDTWSDWSQEIKSPGPVKSPTARFLQWKAEFSRGGRNESPVLDKVSVVGRHVNLAPQIVQINFKPAPPPQPQAPPQPPGAPGQPPSGAPGAGPSAPPGRPASGGNPGGSGNVNLSWQAVDPNGDSLQFSLHFRGKGEERWLLIKDELTSTSYRWDTESVPDGEYEILLTASDRPDNTAEEVKSASMVSETLVVDNTAPRVASDGGLRVERSGKDWIARLTLEDEISPIAAAQYSLDGGEWISILPEDGVFDQSRESFRFRLESEPLEPGAHTLVVRFRDREGNIGAAKRAFRVEK